MKRTLEESKQRILEIISQVGESDRMEKVKKAENTYQYAVVGNGKKYRVR